MARAEQNDLAYLFRLRMTVNVKRDLERASGIRLGRCRPRLAGQGDDAAAARLEPPTPRHPAAPQAGP